MKKDFFVFRSYSPHSDVSVLSPSTSRPPSNVVETVGIEGRLTVLHDDIPPHLRQLCITVVVKVIAVERKRVTLKHTHMTERLKRVRRLEEIGAVAVHRDAVVEKLDIANEYLRVGIQELVMPQRVAMDKLHLFARRLAGTLVVGKGKGRSLG